MRFLLVVGVLALVASCSSTPKPCSGCLDSNGQCQDGRTHQACGVAGGACANCSVLHSICVAGTCLPSSDGGGGGATSGGGGGATGGGGGGGATGGGGGATGGGGGGGATGGGGGAACAGCVDSTGACQSGTAASACGADGGTCADCAASGATCSSSARACVDQRYPDGGSRSRFWDGGACAVKTDCPCFSSDDCAPSFTCHAEDDTGLHVYCVPGVRGAGAAGVICAGEADCESALCVDSSSAGKKCSALCDVAAECPTSLPKCTYIGFGIDRSMCSP